MKIVCESCGAKYSIADEKVAGKVFKIRCKKCSEVIVVRGDQGEDEATRVADVGQAAAPPVEADTVWHIVVNGDQQGPFSPGQIGEMISAGTVDWDAYVWREGFDNWLPVRDVEPLVQAITNGGDAAGGDAGGGGGGGDMGADPFGDAAPASGGLFGGGGGASAFAAEPAPAPAARAARAGGGDLFAQANAGSSPFGGGGDDDDGVVASAQSPRVSSQQAALTGQRNENSVLFSLANLQALATGTPGGGGSSSSSSSSQSSSSQPKAGMAAGEGSGLIDIRALAGAGGSGGGMMMGGGSAPSKKESIDDLLSIGSGGSPFAPTLGAPMLAPAKQEGGNKGLIIGVGLGVVAIVAMAAVVLVVVLGKNNAVPPPAVAAVAPPVIAAPPVAPIAAAPAVVVPAAGTPAIVPPTAGTEPAAGTPERNGTAPRHTGGGGTPRHTGGSDTPAVGGSAPAIPTGGGNAGGGTTQRRPPAGGNSIDDLLGAALNAHPAGGRPAGGGTPAPAPSDAALPDQPGRDQVGAALRAVQTAVGACGAGEHGMATTQITVDGSSGRVTNAVVSGQFAGTPVGSCVARAARSAHFPRFRNPTFSVSFPFRL